MQALRAGLVTHGESSHVAEAAMGDSLLSRAQVKGEAREAVPLALVSGGERSPLATPRQLEQIRLAGLAAVTLVVAAR